MPILALDQGTTSSRALVIDEAGRVVASAQQEFRQIYPQSGWVEHDAHEIWTSQISTAIEALSRARLRAADITALGITNQRETVVIWERASGRPIHNAIVWQDRRTASTLDGLRKEGHESLVRERTGLVLDPYFSAGKVAWILDHVPGARERAERGELAFGTIDSWLVWNLTGGQHHLTDATNASRTSLYDIRAGRWDDELLTLFRVPRQVLPEVRSSSEVYAEASCIGLAGIPIAGIAGDQQAALFGQLCTQPGLIKNTYGTGCFMLMQTGDEPRPSANGLLTTVALQRGGHTTYALEGAVFIGGAVVQWLRDGLKIIDSAADVEPLARSVPDSGGVCLVPAFAGLGAPHWDPYARGVLVGIERGTTRGHIARAALEGIALQCADLVDAMAADAGLPIPELRVDGGAARNDLLMQLQADLLQIPVARPANTESTALGAAFLAGLATGAWTSDSALEPAWQLDRRFEPAIPADQVAATRARWKSAVDRSRGWHVS